MKIKKENIFLAMVKLLIVALAVIYVGGVWKFWGGFRNTNFERNLPTKIVLGLFWPVLMFNRSYRKNFQKALKG
jgi:hypothetical protein